MLEIAGFRLMSARCFSQINLRSLKSQVAKSISVGLSRMRKFVNSFHFIMGKLRISTNHSVQRVYFTPLAAFPLSLAIWKVRNSIWRALAFIEGLSFISKCILSYKIFIYVYIQSDLHNRLNDINIFSLSIPSFNFVKSRVTTDLFISQTQQQNTKLTVGALENRLSRSKFKYFRHFVCRSRCNQFTVWTPPSTPENC